MNSAPSLPNPSRTGLRSQLRAMRQSRAKQKSLTRELAAYTAPNDLQELDAILDRYSDTVTEHLRRILAAQRCG
jgi:hypothetical protein